MIYDYSTWERIRWDVWALYKVIYQLVRESLLAWSLSFWLFMYPLHWLTSPIAFVWRDTGELNTEITQVVLSWKPRHFQVIKKHRGISPISIFEPLSADVMDDRTLSFVTKFPPSVAIESVYKKLPQSTRDPDSLARPIAEILISLTAKVAFLRPGKGRAFWPYRKHFQLMF